MNEKVDINLTEVVENFGKLSKMHRMIIKDAGINPAGKNNKWYTDNRPRLIFKVTDPAKESQKNTSKPT